MERIFPKGYREPKDKNEIYISITNTWIIKFSLFLMLCSAIQMCTSVGGLLWFWDAELDFEI